MVLSHVCHDTITKTLHTATTDKKSSVASTMGKISMTLHYGYSIVCE